VHLIVANGLAVDYGGRTIFSDVSLEIAQDDRIGVVGENGAGKSTLLRVLAGQERPSEGQVTYSKGTRLGYLVQEPHFAPDVTVWDAVARADAELANLGDQLTRLEHAMAVTGDDHTRMQALLDEYGAAQHRYEQLGGYDYDARVRQVLQGLGFGEPDWQTPAEQLSGGQKKLVGLAQLLITKPDVLLLDEPDNHLDFEGKAFLEEYIRDYAGAVALISHDRYLLDRVAQRVVELEDGALTSWPGGYTAYVEQKEAHLARQRALFQVQQEELRRQEEAMYRLVQWARQNPKFAGRAENMKKQVARKREELMDRPRLVRRHIRLDFGQHEGSRRVVQAHGLTIRAGGTASGRVLLDAVDFEVAFGERVGIVGPNGSGKSTLLRVLGGVLPPSAGEVRLGATVRLGYYAQEQETLPVDQTPLEWIRQQKALTEQGGINRLRKLLLTYEDMHAPIGRLSGGQKARLQFERLMLGDYNLLVLDEPTNNIDIASAEVLESALQEYEGTVILVSHDRYLLDHAVDRIVELPGDGTLRQYLGNYSYYLESTARDVGRGREPELAASVVSAPPPSPDPAPVTPRPSSSAPQAPEFARPATPRQTAHHMSVALLGLPGVGKRTLLAELRGLPVAGDTIALAASQVRLADNLIADITIVDMLDTLDADAAASVRRADLVLLVQDLADPSLGQVAALRRSLDAAGITLVPHRLPLQIKARGKGGIKIVGGTDAAREALARWCRAQQIAHAEVTIFDDELPTARLATYAEAAWQRSGRPRANQQSSAALAFRRGLVVGTRYDEMDGGTTTPHEAETRLGQLTGDLTVVALSALDAASVERLWHTLTQLGRDRG
jgi:ATP-binding cassette subfamily F protein 3